MDTHILYAPSGYDHMNAQRKKSALQGSGLVRTVGLCAQRSNVCTKKSSLNASGHSYS